MTQDENPLDRISAGPPPTGPNPWRSNRLPTGSPYAGARSGAGAARGPRRLGRAGWITLVVAVALIAGAVGWAAVSKPDASRFASPILGTSATPPAPPSVAQVTGNAMFAVQLTSPPTCALPPLATNRDAVQAFATAGTVCLEAAWGARPSRVEAFSTPDGVPPGTTCFSRGRVSSYGTCGENTYLNADAAIAGAGNQAAVLLQWLSLAVADHVESASGQSADVRALILATGESTPLANEYRRRAHVQTLCLAGATMHRLVDHGITAADLAQASEQAGVWTVPVNAPDVRLKPATARSWFDRGSLSPTVEVCRTAWTVPGEQVS
ncbi:hypothetical protein [Tsukamurella sp. PLM1]|uniref:hypothetical protein n=1 Tax=Tsukamurella sp. PLM1 TaxID=2929795 RepID=UPI00206D3D75|nr:hypothetical protein [Tsukamurella sp. PLM1]BDH55199.1 hypothetical protein MTP03_01380 [Tsukamurella sp. PLM1]